MLALLRRRISSATATSFSNSPLRAQRTFTTTTTMASSTADKKIALSATEFRSFQVSHIQQLTHNTKKLTFALPTKDHEMGLTVASCLVAKATLDSGEVVVRPYTPVNLNSDKGVLELVVKGYATGKLSKHIVETLQVGDWLEMKGPFPKFTYKANQFHRIGLIAGGTGITPAFQVIKQIVHGAPQDATQVDLIYANTTEKDILLRRELDEIAATHANVRVHYVLSEPGPSNDWKGYTGYVTPSLIHQLLPPSSSSPSSSILIGVCGPPRMMDAICGDKNPDKTQGALTGFLHQLDYTSDQVYKF